MIKYSRRLSWSFSINHFSEAVAAHRAAGKELLDLTVSNPTQAFAEYPHDAVARALGGLDHLRYSPDPFGLPAARRAVANYYAERTLRIDPERIALTASSSEAYAILFKLLCDPGDEVLIPTPSYPLFEYLANLESVRIVPYRLQYDGSWFIDFDDMKRGVSQRTRAIVIVNPNNPTGSYLKQQEVDRLLAMCNRNRIPVISDEVFMDYGIVELPDRIPTLLPFDAVPSFSLGGLSKSAAMPQMKLGWLVLNGPPAAISETRRRLEIILDTYLSVGTPVQQALPALLKIGGSLQQQVKCRIRRNLGAAVNLLQDTAAHCLHTEGGWSLIVRLPRLLAEEEWISRLLNRHSVIVQPGYFFDMASEPFLVLSLLTPEDSFQAGVQRLRDLVNETTRA